MSITILNEPQYWFTAFLLVILSLALYINYHVYQKEILTYDVLLKLFVIISICFALVLLSKTISQILAKSRIIQKWYTTYKQKEDMKKRRNEK